MTLSFGDVSVCPQPLFLAGAICIAKSIVIETNFDICSGNTEQYCNTVRYSCTLLKDFEQSKKDIYTTKLMCSCRNFLENDVNHFICLTLSRYADCIFY